MIRILVALLFAAAACFGQSYHIWNVIPKQDGSATGEIRFFETSTGFNYVGWKAPASITANSVWTLPASAGSTGECLKITGSLTTGWGSCGGSPPFVHTQMLLKNQVTEDATTKFLRFDLTAVTPGYTVIYDVQDSNAPDGQIIAATNLPNGWSVDQVHAADILPDASDSRKVGKSTQYWNEIWGNNVYGRAIRFKDNSGVASTEWVGLANVNLLGTVSNWHLKDNTGTSVIELHRTIAGVSVNDGTLRSSWIPGATKTFDLGREQARWDDFYAYMGYMRRLELRKELDSMGVPISSGGRPCALIEHFNGTNTVGLCGSNAASGDTALYTLYLPPTAPTDGQVLSALSGGATTVLEWADPATGNAYPAVNVQDYGATGDDTTNDQAAINAALLDVPANGGQLYFPRGTYYVRDAAANGTTTTVALTVSNPGIRIFCESPGSTEIRWASDQPDGKTAMFHLNAENITIENCTFNGNGAGRATKMGSWGALYITGSYARVRNNTFTGHTSIHLSLYDGVGTIIESNRILGLTSSPHDTYGFWADKFAHAWTFRNNYVKDNCINGMLASGKNVLIEGNVFTGNHRDIAGGGCDPANNSGGQLFWKSVAADYGTRIIGNAFVEGGASASGIELGDMGTDFGPGPSVIGNTIRNNPLWGIAVQGGQNGIISGNLIQNNGADGIWFDNDGSNPPNGWQVANNWIYSNTGHGIEIESGISNWSVIGNNMQTNASGQFLDSTATGTAKTVFGNIGTTNSEISQTILPNDNGTLVLGSTTRRFSNIHSNTFQALNSILATGTSSGIFAQGTGWESLYSGGTPHFRKSTFVGTPDSCDFTTALASSACGYSFTATGDPNANATVLHVQSDSISAGLILEGFGGSVNFIKGVSSRGAIGVTHTASQSGDQFLNVAGNGNDGTTAKLGGSGAMTINASENWNSFSRGTTVRIETTPWGGFTTRRRTVEFETVYNSGQYEPVIWFINGGTNGRAGGLKYSILNARMEASNDGSTWNALGGSTNFLAIGSNMTPSSDATYNIGSHSARWATILAQGAIAISDGVNNDVGFNSSRFFANGANGIIGPTTLSVRNGEGSGACSIVINGGIVTSSDC
jgi:parallel beta-helix repeat protein